MLNALTIDFEEYFHLCGVLDQIPPGTWGDLPSRIESQTQTLLDLLERHGTRATFFVVGWLASQRPDLVRRIAGEGHEIATHGHFHLRPTELTPDGFEADLIRSLESLEGAIQGIDGDTPRVIGYRAPEWGVTSKTDWVYPILARHGIRYSSSTVPLTGMGDRTLPRLPHEIKTPDGPVLEFPCSTMRCFWDALPYSGGLPLRFSPLWYTLIKIRRTNREGHPALLYLHPWEFDDHLPELDVPGSRRFIQRFNLPATHRKAEELMSRLQFGTMANVLGFSNVAESTQPANSDVSAELVGTAHSGDSHD